MAYGRKTGIYVHIPFCRKKCDYCDFYSVEVPGDTAGKAADRYTSALRTHLAETAQKTAIPVDTVYFGGGTPAMLGLNNLCEVMKLIRKHYQLSEGAEITIELNPESSGEKLLRGLKKAGFNRVSIGVQSAVDSELEKLGRLHDFAGAREAVRIAREAGFTNLSVDLMYGLEGQTMESLEYSVLEILKLRPEHVSCYALKVEENTPLWRRQDTAALPDDDTLADMYLVICSLLRDAGYIHYEISNFAKPGFESRHNLKYWRLEPYLGFGASAHSDYRERRYSIVRSVDDFMEGIETGGAVIDEMEEILPRERAAEYLMLRLRLLEGFDPYEYERVFGRPIDTIESKLREYEKQGLARYDGRWSLTEKGFLLSNRIIASLI
jgi:putative oxygen-independent coproporphyrinogen III oxidase